MYAGCMPLVLSENVAVHESEWNIMVGHRSLFDQLVFMTDHNFSLIGHTYMMLKT